MNAAPISTAEQWGAPEPDAPHLRGAGAPDAGPDGNGRTGRGLDAAVLKAHGLQWGSARHSAAGWPVHPALSVVLPDGLPRGVVMTVSGSVSLALAVIGAASAGGAWCALVGLPPLCVDAAAGFGIELERTPIVDIPAREMTARGWAGAMAALIDAADVVVARPGAPLAAGDTSRLAARARSKEASLLILGESGWSGADIRISATGSSWERAAGPRGRLTSRRLMVERRGRGRFAQPGAAELYLPDAGGGVSVVLDMPTAARTLRVVRP